MIIAINSIIPNTSIGTPMLNGLGEGGGSGILGLIVLGGEGLLCGALYIIYMIIKKF